MKINRLIAKIVEERGLKQLYIAEKTGLTPDVVSKILRGERRLTAEEFLTFCDVLNISPDIFRSNVA